MKKNLFEMGASWDDEWNSDNKQKISKKIVNEIKEPSKHRLYISKEKRRGKIVTIIQPFYLSKDELKRLLKNVKSSLGCGGTIKENSLEFQGEVAKVLKQIFIEKGFRFK